MHESCRRLDERQLSQTEHRQDRSTHLQERQHLSLVRRRVAIRTGPHTYANRTYPQPLHHPQQQTIHEEAGHLCFLSLFSHSPYAQEDLQVASTQQQGEITQALITSRLDYRNTLYVGIIAQLRLLLSMGGILIPPAEFVEFW